MVTRRSSSESNRGAATSYEFFEELSPRLVGLETSHYWARELKKLGSRNVFT
jgi:transposase